MIAGDDGEPAVAIVTASTPDDAERRERCDDGSTAATTTTPDSASDGPDAPPVQATAFPFKLPSAPGPGDSQAVAVGTKDGGVTYNVAYSLVTVKDGAR